MLGITLPSGIRLCIFLACNPMEASILAKFSNEKAVPGGADRGSVGAGKTSEKKGPSVLIISELLGWLFLHDIIQKYSSLGRF